MFCVGVMCFGVYAATSVSYTLSGHITYDVNDVFVDIDTTLYASNKDLYTSQSNIAEDMHSISAALESGTSVPTTNLDAFSYVDHQSSLNNVGDGEMSYVAKALDLNYGSYVADTTSYAYYLAITISNYADETISAILDLDSLYDLNANVIITPERTMENIPAGTSESPSKVCLVFGLILDNPANSIDISFDGVNLSVNKGELQETPGLSFTAIDNGEAYSVSSGTANAERLVIPAYHEGKPVTTANVGVGYNGDYRSTKPWKEIYFPNTLTTISNTGITSSPNLRYVYLPQSITNIGSCFLDACESVKTLYIPENVVSYKPTSGVINRPLGEGAGVINYLLTSHLYSLYVNENNTAFLSQDSIMYNKDKTEIYACVGKKVGTLELTDSVTSIGEKAFNGCSSLTSITILNNDISIGTSAFLGCQFTAVTYSTSGEGYTFENGTLTITGDISDSPAWYSANISGLVTSVVFKENIAITNIGENAFRECSSLKTISIPESVKNIGEYAFSYCENLGTVTFEGKSKLESIVSSAFTDCSSLTTITIPKSVISIGPLAFSSCSSLTSAYFEDTQNTWTVSGKTISTELQNPNTMATYLTSTYLYFSWTKNV